VSVLSLGMADASAVQEAEEPIPLARSLKVAEVVARQLAKDVVERGLPPGTVLPSEAAMLKRYGVGRASLREALRILEIYGLIRMKPGPGGGPVVTEVESRAFADSSSFFFFVHRATLRQVIEAKDAVEPMLARLAAERADANGVARLTRVIEAERIEMAASDAWGSKPAEFHRLLAELGGNPVLGLFANSILELQRKLNNEFPTQDRAATLRLHERVAAAIKKRDGAEAERLMHRHAAQQMKRMEALMPGALDEIVEW
jgi:GntR family transcriptional repressor for pyruvate dehydrogenase complex